MSLFENLRGGAQQDARLDNLREDVTENTDRITALEERDPGGSGGVIAPPQTVIVGEDIPADGDLAANILKWLHEHGEINHRIIIPSGSYLWNTEFAITKQFDYLEIRGAPRATLQVRDHAPGLAFRIGDRKLLTEGDAQPARRFALRNVRVDISDIPERDCGIIHAQVGHRCLIDDVDLWGTRWRHGGHKGDRFNVLVNMWWPDGVGHIKSVSQPHGEKGSTEKTSVGHAIAYSADPPHRGTNIWEGCFVKDSVDNGFYTANSPGRNILIGCKARNCGGTNIRPGSNDEVRGGWIIIDNGSQQTHPGAGLWLNEHNAVVDGLTIQAPEAYNDVIRANSSTAGGTIKNVDVEVGRRSTCRAIRLSGTGEHRLTLENIRVRDASQAQFRGDFSVYAQRPRTTIRDLDLRTERAGVIVSGLGTRLKDCDVSGQREGVTVGANGVDLRGTRIHSGGLAIGGNVDSSTINRD